MRAIREIIQNILKGRINLKKKQKMFLSRYKKVLRGFVSRKKLSPSSQKRYLVQKGGFLPTLLVPVVSMLASVFAENFCNEYINSNDFSFGRSISEIEREKTG